MEKSTVIAVFGVATFGSAAATLLICRFYGKSKMLQKKLDDIYDFFGDLTDDSDTYLNQGKK